MNEGTERPVVGEVCLRRKRRKRQKKLLKQLFQDYSKNTTLHGLRYTTEKGLHIIEKIFWLVTFIVSVALSFYLISKVWNKWNTSPVIVSFSEKHLFVKEVPFPAITICPAVKFKNFNYTEILADLENHEVIDNDTLATASAVNLFCDLPAWELINELPGDWMDRLLNVSMEVEDIFYICKLGKNNCKNLVKRVLTEDGICYNINGLAASDILNYNTIQREYKYSYNDHEAKNWTFTEGYTNDDVNAYPYRGQESGETPYLNLNLANLEPIKDKNCNVVHTGYKIYLHHPADWPQAQSYYFAALPEQVSSMAVEFSAVSTSKDLQAVALNVRQCYFPEERPLKYFKIYSYNHCRQECLTNFTYARCGCVMTYMPYHTHDKICSSGSQIYCFRRANDVFSTEGSEHLQDCRCLPACNYIQYDADIHKTEFNFAELQLIQLKKYQKYYKKPSGHDVDLKRHYYESSSVEIFFKKPMFMAIHRSELFGITDFLGICGGLLGLFLGFSFLSIVEIFYFLTFRVFKTIRHDLKTEKLDDPPNIFHVEKLHNDITDLPLHLK